MAGGDGSRPWWGTVAAELGLPMVVVPAGTRNHLAPISAWTARRGRRPRRHVARRSSASWTSLTSNGHVFVNNVSLGVYAAIVRSPSTGTTSATPRWPRCSPGPRAAVRCSTRRQSDGVSGPAPTSSRSRTTPTAAPGLAGLDQPAASTPTSSGHHPIVLDCRPPVPASAALAAATPSATPGATWSRERPFEVGSGAPSTIGLDGDHDDGPALRFSIRPDPVRVRLPGQAIGSPAACALARHPARPPPGLGQVLGRPTQSDHLAAPGRPSRPREGNPTRGRMGCRRRPGPRVRSARRTCGRPRGPGCPHAGGPLHEQARPAPTTSSSVAPAAAAPRAWWRRSRRSLTTPTTRAASSFTLVGRAPSAIADWQLANPPRCRGWPAVGSSPVGGLAAGPPPPAVVLAVPRWWQWSGADRRSRRPVTIIPPATAVAAGPTSRIPGVCIHLLHRRSLGRRTVGGRPGTGTAHPAEGWRSRLPAMASRSSVPASGGRERCP